LEQKGISAQVVSFHTVKPLDTDFLRNAFSSFLWWSRWKTTVFLAVSGGSVAEWLADNPSPARLCRIGTPDEFLMEAVDNDSARERFGLSPEAMSAKVLSFSRTFRILKCFPLPLAGEGGRERVGVGIKEGGLFVGPIEYP
jgi:transketolase